MSIEILEGNCLDTLKQLPDQCVNTCITSPPYWGLRDYGTATWIGGDPNCNHMRDSKVNPSGNTDTGHKAMFEKDNAVGDAIYKSECHKCGAKRKDQQLGLEDTPDQFVENLVNVFREVRRVLKDDGTVWLNLGDSYHRSGSDQPTQKGMLNTSGINEKYGWDHKHKNKLINLKPKDLVGIPWKVAFGLQADGWYLRQDIIWHKPNPMPESVKDRCTKSHEYIFLLSKNAHYYFDHESIKVESSQSTEIRNKNKFNGAFKGQFKGTPNEKRWQEGRPIDEPKFSIDGKSNKRSVWTVTTKPYSEAHFATYPHDLIIPCIKAGCPEKVCASCGESYVRGIESTRLKRNELSKNDPRYRPNTYEGTYKNINGKADAGYTQTKDLGLQKQCQCETNETKSGTVLDPFGGSGTTAQVAAQLNRNAIICELNPEYIKIANQRLLDSLGMFLDLKITKPQTTENIK